MFDLSVADHHNFVVEGVVLHNSHRVRDPGTKAYKALANTDAEKRLLLTASPFYNHPADLAPLVNLAAGGKVLPAQRSEFEQKYIHDRLVQPGFFQSLRGIKPGVVTELNPMSKRELASIMAKWVDYYPSSSKGFPGTSEDTIEVPMDSDQLRVYDTMMGKAPFWVAAKVKAGLPPSKAESKELNAFLGAVRQVSNTTAGFAEGPGHSPKIQRAYEELQKEIAHNPQARAVVYSNYLESGLTPYKQLLEHDHVPYGEFTGQMKHKEREQMVRDYNEGKLRALLISAAGGEGLDLKKTSLMQLLDPHWNAERGNQVIGRGVRYQSHEGLPEEEQKVRIQRFLATRPRAGMLEKMHLKDPGMGVDQYLTQMSADKSLLINQFKGLLEEQNQREMAEAAAKEQEGLKAAGLNTRDIQRIFKLDRAAAEAEMHALRNYTPGASHLQDRIRHLAREVDSPPMMKNLVVETNAYGSGVQGVDVTHGASEYRPDLYDKARRNNQFADRLRQRVLAGPGNMGPHRRVLDTVSQREMALYPRYERELLSGRHGPEVQVPQTVTDIGEHVPSESLAPERVAYRGTQFSRAQKDDLSADTPRWVTAHPDVATAYAHPAGVSRYPKVRPAELTAYATEKMPSAGPWTPHIAKDPRAGNVDTSQQLAGDSAWGQSPTYERVVDHGDLQAAQTHRYVVMPSGIGKLLQGDPQTSPVPLLNKTAGVRLQSAASKTAAYSEGPSSTFSHAGRKYSVDKALEAVEGKRVQQLPTNELTWVFKYTKPDEGRKRVADSSIPLLVTKWEDKTVVVDGLHRLAKAQESGQVTVPTRSLQPSDLRKALIVDSPRRA